MFEGERAVSDGFIVTQVVYDCIRATEVHITHCLYWCAAFLCIDDKMFSPERDCILLLYWVKYSQNLLVRENQVKFGEWVLDLGMVRG